MMARSSLSLWKRTGCCNSVPRRQTSDRRQQCASDDEECPSTPAVPVVNVHHCLSSFHTDCLNACHDHSLTCAQASKLWYHTAFIFPLYTSLFLSLFICIPPLTPSPSISFSWLTAIAIPSFHLHICRLLSIPAANGGDSQIASPELVCSSLGVRAANQRLWWEERDGFKLHPSQSTGGAHESATSCRFSPSWGSLQINSDSTLLTSETPTRASPIKGLLWFPLLIINVSELSDVVRVCVTF